MSQLNIESLIENGVDDDGSLVYMKLLISFLLTFGIYLSSCQEIKVDSVTLYSTFGNTVSSYIPRVSTKNNPDLDKLTHKINETILDRFFIDSYVQSDSDKEKLAWRGLVFSSVIKEGILYINYSGVYMGAYPSDIEGEFFFDLSNGKEIERYDIPFHALFKLDGYFSFLEKFWIDDAKDVFKGDKYCSSYAGWCTFYDISKYRLESNFIELHLSDDCTNRASRACAPHLRKKIPIDSLNDYLSDIGKEILFDNDYSNKLGIDKYVVERNLQKLIPLNAFITGKIDAKYPFSMALNINKDNGEIKGFYYYDSKKKNISLSGKHKSSWLIVIEEHFQEKLTGYFEFKKYSGAGLGKKTFAVDHPIKSSFFLYGEWISKDKSRRLEIEFNDVKITN